MTLATLTMMLLISNADAKKPRLTNQSDVRHNATSVTPKSCTFDGINLNVSGRELYLGPSLGKPAANFNNFFQRTWVSQNSRTFEGPAMPVAENQLETVYHTDPKAWIVSACTGTASASAGIEVLGLNTGLQLNSNAKYAVVYGALGNVSIEPYVWQTIVGDTLARPSQFATYDTSLAFDLRSIVELDIGYMCVLSVREDSQKGGISLSVAPIVGGAKAQSGLAASHCPPELTNRLLELRAPDQSELLSTAASILAEYAADAIEGAQGGPMGSSVLAGVVLGQVVSQPLHIPAKHPQPNGSESPSSDDDNNDVK